MKPDRNPSSVETSQTVNRTTSGILGEKRSLVVSTPSECPRPDAIPDPSLRIYERYSQNERIGRIERLREVAI